MFSVFLMMINIIHNRISLTHIISVHSHRGAYTFHLHVSINDNVILLTRAVNLVLEPGRPLSHSHLYNHGQQSLRFVEHPYNIREHCVSRS